MRRILIAACLGALSIAGIGHAGAYFTDQVSIAENIITAGTVEVSTVPTSSALSIPVLAPGETTNRSVAVSNDGTLDVNMVVTGAKKAGFTALYEALTCRVVRGSTVLYEGTMTDLRTMPVEIVSGGSVGLVFEVGLPADADNDLAGDYVKMTLYFDAEQVHP